MKNLITTVTVISAIAWSFNTQAATGRDVAPERKGTETRQQSQDFAAKVRLEEVAQKIGLPVTEVRSFFKSEIESGRANMVAWGEIATQAIAVKRNATKQDLLANNAAASLLRSYISIRQAKQADTINIREADLAEVLNSSSWSLMGKEKLATVLDRTATLLNAKNSKFVTTEDAFNQAMKEMGLDGKYNRCRL